MFEDRRGTISGLNAGTGPIGAFVGLVTVDFNLSMKPLVRNKQRGVNEQKVFPSHLTKLMKLTEVRRRG